MPLLRTVLLGVLLWWMPMEASAWNWRTRISLSLHEQPLSAACRIMEKEYGIRFSYSSDIVNMSRRVSINARDMPLRRVLELLLTENGIEYKRIGGQLVLTVRQRKERTLSGYVEDALTGEKLIGATVFIPLLQVGAVTNQYGYFSLTAARDTMTLAVSYIGYQLQQIPLKDKENRVLNIRLHPTNTLQEVEVTDSLPKLQDQTQMSKVNVSVAQARAMPRVLGEADVMKLIQAMPGVSGGMEGTSTLHVRGGSPDQNLILLDGMPVYNASHVLGIFSVFNPDAIKNVDLYKGAFPARYGGRLSSVVDISMKDGNMQHWAGETSLGLLAMKVMTEGPIKKNKTSVIASFRRTYADLLMTDVAKKELELGEKGEFLAYFFDANFKINHIFSPRDRIYASVYGGQDQMEMRRDMVFDTLNGYAKRYHENIDFKLGWGNQAYSLRWNHIFHPRLFANTTAHYSQFSFNTDYRYKYQALDTPQVRESDDMAGRYYSRVHNAGLKVDFDYRPDPRNVVRFGGQATWHKFEPGIMRFNNKSDEQQLTDTSYNTDTHNGVELAVYLEDDWKLSDSMHLNLGVHISAFLTDGRGYTAVQPRLGFRYMLPHKWALKLSYTMMTQYIHLLTNNATYLPTDLWVAATEKVPPMHSVQLAGGLARTSNDERYEFSAEAYYKSMRNVIEYTEMDQQFSSATRSWEEQVVVGNGWSYGAEFLLQKKKGSFKGWVGYTLAWAQRAFPGVNNGSVFPYKYDRRHELEVVLSKRLGKRWELSGQWQYSSGLPMSLPAGAYEQITDPSPHLPPGTEGPGEVDVTGRRYGLRMQDVHRLDIGATHTKERNGIRYILTLSLYNVYNRKNPFFYYYKRNETGERRELTMLSILPILPSISYGIKF
ncbi:TonB-dependent receptor domain-containing protein [Chitinophaga lutea]